MGCCRSLQASPNDELAHLRVIYAQIYAAAQESGNDQSTWDLCNLIRGIRESSPDAGVPFNYTGFRGLWRAHGCVTTGVLDYLLVGCRIAANAYRNVKELFEQDATIHAVMTLLDRGRYAEAKVLWIVNLDLREGRVKRFTESECADVGGEVTEQLSNFSDLTGTGIYYGDRMGPNLEDHLYSKTVSTFGEFGDVRALGPRRDPQLILVSVAGGMDTFPPPIVSDDYERKFKLQFLLLGTGTASSGRAALCTCLDGGWRLCGDAETPPFGDVRAEDLRARGYAVYLAAYVNVTGGGGKRA